MKQRTLYTCEICHTDYADKYDAEQCEKNHSRSAKLKIVDAKYHPYSVDRSGMPAVITVQGENGKTAKYRRQGR